MKSQRDVLRQIIGECDSMIVHTRPNLPYRGLSKETLVAGVKIIRSLAKKGIGTQRRAKPKQLEQKERNIASLDWR